MSTSDAFKNTEPSLMEPAQYRALLETLLANAEGWGKTEPVAAYLLSDFTITTEMDSGEKETTRNIAVTFEAGKKERAYLMIDPKFYPLERTRQQVVVDMAKNWAQKNIKNVNERDLTKPDFKGPGIWVNKQSSVEFDYLQPAKGDIWQPNPDATRLILRADKPINVPVTWAGGFVVKKDGVLAVREIHVAELVESLQAIAKGQPAAAVLYKEPGIVLTDVYGMMPNFLEENYNPKPLKPETLETIAALKPARPKAGPGPAP